MYSNILIALLLIFSNCSGTAQPTTSGLLIDNGMYRGTVFTDGSGATYNLRYMPITISNDSTVPIQIQLEFSKEYNFPEPYNDKTFGVVPLPEEWGLDGVGITDSMRRDLSGVIDKPILQKTLKPGEKALIAIGAFYPRPAESSGVRPDEMFAFETLGMLSDCEWEMEADPSLNDRPALGLRLRFGNSCRVISCGFVSFP